MSAGDSGGVGRAGAGGMMPGDGGSFPAGAAGTGIGGDQGLSGGGGVAGSASGNGGGGATSGAGGTQSGTGGGEAACSNVTPCGGDLVGTWNVTSSCLTVSGELNPSAIGLGCSSVPVTGALEVTGTWTANSDGTYSDNTTTSGNEQFDLPPECLLVSGVAITCDRIGGPLTSLGYASAACTDAASGGCTCLTTVDQTGGIGLAPADVSASGTYSTSDAMLAVGTGDQEYSYCVSGATLTMSPQSTPRTGTLTGSVELQML